MCRKCAPERAPSSTPASSATPHFVATEVIAEVKDFAIALGGQATENFVRYSDQQVSDNRCYFTGKLQLPEFYSSLRMVREDGDRCAARGSEHDVFFYPVQAVASGEEMITVSLAEASTERMLVVVPHEDFHNQREARKAPTEVAEAAATLVGFLTASGFAKDRFGPDSTTALTLARDAELFLQKSFLVNQYYEKVSGLYREFQSGTLTQAQAFEKKAELFPRAAALVRGDCAGAGVVQQVPCCNEQRRPCVRSNVYAPTIRCFTISTRCSVATRPLSCPR